MSRRVPVTLGKVGTGVGAALLLAGTAPAQPVPYSAYVQGAQPGAASATPPLDYPRAGYSDQDNLRTVLSALKGGSVSQAVAARDAIGDPLARKAATWAIVDAAPERLSFFELDQARRDLWGWPRREKRATAAERLLVTAGLGPAQTEAWFGGEPPLTGWGALALADAYRAQGREGEAQALIRSYWRDHLFEADAQSAILARYGGSLSADDHVARADMLLLGPQGPAARAMIPLLAADQQEAANVRIALRNGGAGAQGQADALPGGLSTSPGVAFERARSYRKAGLDTLAFQQLRYFPQAPGHAEGAKLVWTERKQLIGSALKAGNYRAAYEAASNTGLEPGADLAEAEFFAGWLALTRLRDPALADRHFYGIQGAGTSPITQSRALYWRGRAAEARGDGGAAQAFYREGGQYKTAFYGQLAAEKAGDSQLAIGGDPVPTAADRARFEGRELVRAARLFNSIGAREQFRTFVLQVDDAVPNAEEAALLVDLANQAGDLDLALRTARASAQRGFVLPERGYPVRRVNLPAGAAPMPFVLSIVRQESSFDPRAKSSANAHGMMQLLPGTASDTARRMGESYSFDRLYDPEWNMRVGSVYLGQMTDRFSGSWIMAAAAYNAGPGRPPQWVQVCGDPRNGSVDPLDFIECVPFSETRNYIMRTMETAQVYKARLNGGVGQLTLTQDLRRGGYSYSAAR